MRQQKRTSPKFEIYRLEAIRAADVLNGNLESLETSPKLFTRAPKGENYNQFQPLLSI